MDLQVSSKPAGLGSRPGTELQAAPGTLLDQWLNQGMLLLRMAGAQDGARWTFHASACITSAPILLAKARYWLISTLKWQCVILPLLWRWGTMATWQRVWTYNPVTEEWRIGISIPINYRYLEQYKASQNLGECIYHIYNWQWVGLPNIKVYLTNQ